jgi:serine/threonine-protein kinase HipA
MNSLKITYEGKFAGVCNFNPENGKTFFQYSPDFLQSGIQLSPLLLPLENRIFEFAELPPMLADSLPDDFGNKMFLQWLLKNNISQNALNPLEKLCYIGKRGMGAFRHFCWRS